MSNFFLKVRKLPYREDGHLTFVVYKHEDNELLGLTYRHKVVEHFERLSFYERNKAGSITDIICIQDTEYERYFSVNNNDYVVGSLSEAAKEIVDSQPDYRQQFTTFVELIHRMGMSKYPQ
ncbi:hypothetical protein [Paenibacillus agaridevorans]|uniref:hypothetical protein n=1 Tax=Paenibacillus agaridevorans TaxID=171404 RepID=UPI0011B2779E|nr:hypothetical protein [Paenibacillus agaridevorans]